MPNAPQAHRPNGKTPRQEYDQRRGSAAERGYGPEWEAAKKEFLRVDLLRETEQGDLFASFCRYCGKVEAKSVDHALPMLRYFPYGSVGYKQMFWDKRFWIPCGTPKECPCNTLKGDKLPEELKQAEPEIYNRMQTVLLARGVKI